MFNVHSSPPTPLSKAQRVTAPRRIACPAKFSHINSPRAKSAVKTGRAANSPLTQRAKRAVRAALVAYINPRALGTFLNIIDDTSKNVSNTLDPASLEASANPSLQHFYSFRPLLSSSQEPQNLHPG